MLYAERRRARDEERDEGDEEDEEDEEDEAVPVPGAQGMMVEETAEGKALQAKVGVFKGIMPLAVGGMLHAWWSSADVQYRSSLTTCFAGQRALHKSLTSSLLVCFPPLSFSSFLLPRPSPPPLLRPNLPQPEPTLPSPGATKSTSSAHASTSCVACVRPTRPRPTALRSLRPTSTRSTRTSDRSRR